VPTAAGENPVAMWPAARAGGMAKVTKGTVPLRRVEESLCIERPSGLLKVIGNFMC
jgi:hypothetical protein